MKNLRELDKWRITDPKTLEGFGGWAGDETCGAFIIPSPGDHKQMVVIASAYDGWDHVSVSREKRVPNWYEMAHIHRLFFKGDEVVMQLHVPASEHVNIHPNVLHLWRPHQHTGVIPLPPKAFV